MKKNQAQKFIVLFLFFLFAYSWRVEAQTGKEKQITMEFKNEGLPSIFKRFEKVSGYKVLFIYDEISSYTSTGKVEKATVDEALKVIIGKNPLKYHIDGQFINITKEDSKKFFSQVKGKVFSEEDGLPVIGATIIVEDANNIRAITDNNGNFQLSNVSKDSRVRISYVGLETQFLNPSSYMSVVMKSDTKALDEVVVTGMFNRKKEGFTGSAVTIKGEELKKYSTNNVAKAIAAVAPGLRIMDNINMGSNPNNLPDMRMRGGANMDLNAQATVDLNSASNDVLAVQGEYAPLVERLGGQVIEIAPDSPNHISPMDVQMDMGSGDSPLSLKADFLLSLCELVVGGRDGLQPIEKTVIDRCVRQVYREMALGLETAKTPLLQDLYEELLRQPEPEAKRIATALELYCTGSLNLFNHPTNVNLNSRVVCFVLKGMGENLRKIAMHITNDFVTSAVGTNFKNGVATWCYFDEFHILLRDPLTASYFVTVWKMLRKQGCVPSALTQNVKDLLASREIENILDNTDFMILLSQAQSDRAILAKQIGISEHQLSYITQSNSGEGLLFYGSVTIPFVDRFPRGEIYDLLTTKPEDAANGKQAE